MNFGSHSGQAFSLRQVLLSLVFCIICNWPVAVQAKTITIVALGASNTMGYRASRPWPAQLQQALRKKGYEVSVSNQGVFGDTTRGMLRRLHSAVPRRTSLVILQPGVVNDKRAGIYGKERYYIGQIRHRLSALHIKLIVLLNLRRIAGQDTFVDKAHFSNKGHARVAAYLLPRVFGALRAEHN